ncbi:MAG: hypothetical protein Q6370_008660 [Candidatus Sigynarchaeota archaeon]
MSLYLFKLHDLSSRPRIQGGACSTCFRRRVKRHAAMSRAMFHGGPVLFLAGGDPQQVGNRARSDLPARWPCLEEPGAGGALGIAVKERGSAGDPASHPRALSPPSLVGYLTGNVARRVLDFYPRPICRGRVALAKITRPSC